MTTEIALQKIAQAKAEGWKTLDLAGLDLEELPPELWELTQLETLILGKLDEDKEKWFGNRLKEIPEAIVSLTNLTHLYLGSHQLSSLPK